MSLTCDSSTPPVETEESGGTENPFSPDLTTRLDLIITEAPYETTTSTSHTTVPINTPTQTASETTSTLPKLTTIPSITTTTPSFTTPTPSETTTPHPVSTTSSTTTTTLPIATSTPAETSLASSVTNPAIYDGVSEFIVGTCQLCSESNVKEPTDMQDLIVFVNKYYWLGILCGSCAEFFIQPLHSCIGDTDLFKTALNYRAFKDENVADSYHDVHYFCDRIVCLVIVPYEHYPSFVQLRIFGEIRYNWESRCFDFIRNDDRQIFLMNQKIAMTEMIEVGPALRSLRVDYVQSIWCPQWPNEAKDWPLRRRKHGWPTTAIIHKVVQTGCHVVFVTHPDCRDDEYQFRLSFSVAEVILIQSWTKVQQIVYHMIRFFAKRELIQKDCPKEEEVLCTYHFKTLMLWSCEKNSPEWWSSCSVVEICSKLLEVLARWLKEKNCRNYFISRANLFRERLNQEKVNETSKKLYKFSNSDILCRWFTIQYMQPESKLCQNALCAIYERCLIAILEAIDDYISKLFCTFVTVVPNRATNILKQDNFTNSIYHYRVLSIWFSRDQFLPFSGFDSCLWFYGSMLRMLNASSLLECKEMQFDSEWFIEELRQISNKPNIVVYKHHILRRQPSTAANESQLCFIKALYLMENLNGSTDNIEFQVLSQVSKKLLRKSLICEDSERDTITKAALPYLAALHFAKSEYQTVLNICSTVILKRKTEEQETEILDAGCLLYVQDISMIIGFRFIFIKLKDASLHYFRRPFPLELRLTSDIFVDYLEISAIERISSIERAGKVLRLNNISKQPTFPIDAILMKITNRKSSQLSQKGFRVLLLAYKRTNQMNELEAFNKRCLPNEDHLIQLLMTFALQNMTSCYISICEKVGIDCNVVDCYRAAYLYKCCRYREMLDLCDKILHEPDQLESLREFRFANVTVLPPLDTFFDSDVQCVVGLHTLAYYLSPLNDVLQKRKVNYTSTFQHEFAEWIFDEKVLLSEFALQISVFMQYVLGRHFLTRYLKVRHLIEIGCYSDALLELKKLKGNRPFENMLDVFLRKKLRRLKNDIN